MDETNHLIADRELKLRVFNNLSIARKVYTMERIAEECGVSIGDVLSIQNAHRRPYYIYKLMDDGLGRLL